MLAGRKGEERVNKREGDVNSYAVRGRASILLCEVHHSSSKSSSFSRTVSHSTTDPSSSGWLGQQYLLCYKTYHREVRCHKSSLKQTTSSGNTDNTTSHHRLMATLNVHVFKTVCLWKNSVWKLSNGWYELKCDAFLLFWLEAYEILQSKFSTTEYISLHSNYSCWLHAFALLHIVKLEIINASDVRTMPDASCIRY